MQTMTHKFDKVDLDAHVEAAITNKRKKEFDLEKLVLSFFSEILQILFTTAEGKALWDLIKKQGFEAFAIMQNKQYLTSEMRSDEVGYFVEVLMKNGAHITLPEVNFMVDGDLEQIVFDPISKITLDFFSEILLVDREQGLISAAHHHIGEAARKECLGVSYNLSLGVLEVIRQRPFSGRQLQARIPGLSNSDTVLDKAELISQHIEEINIRETAIYAIHKRVVYRSM